MRLYKMGAVEVMGEGMEMGRGWMTEKRSEATPRPLLLFSLIYSSYILIMLFF